MQLLEVIQEIVIIAFEGRPYTFAPADAMILRSARNVAIVRGGVLRLGAHVDNIFKSRRRGYWSTHMSHIPVQDNLLSGGDSSMHLLMFHRNQRQ